ncbi:MAG: hypothetical protein U0835_19240 [Isosphaeraceae bacterium]
MFDQILDNYRRAAETTMQFQQSMLRSWFQQQTPTLFGFPNIPNPGAALLDQAQSAQKKWSETVTAMLNKHRELLDAQYKAGIKTIEDAFKVGEARDPEHFRRLIEELWKHSFDALKTVTEDQTKEFQGAMQKWFELAAQSTGVKV